MKQVEPEFFKADEIAQVAHISHATKYRSGSSEDERIGSHIKENLIPKTRYWVESVNVDSYVATPRPRWQVNGYFLGYTWGTLCKQGDEDRGIYFTVGVAFDKQVLLYKLDCQRKGSSNVTLTDEQIKRFDKVLEKSGIDWQTIPLKEIPKWNWRKLVEATEDFMIQNESLYEKLISQVWREKRKVIETAIARLCWNTNGWVKPSGRLGKAKTPSYEKEFGFGHEEWLFDLDKVIGKYHYGFLEQMRKSPRMYIGKTFNLLLYTRNSVAGQKYWVGHLNGVEALDDVQAGKVLQDYKAKGWLRSMRDDLLNVGLDGDKIFKDANRRALDVINVRFNSSALSSIFEQPIRVDEQDKSISIPRYLLIKNRAGLRLSDEEKGKTGYSFESGSSDEPDLARGAKKTVSQRQVELELKHNELSKSFFKFLKSKYGDNVKRECKAFGTNKIDIVLRTDNGDIFYEIKTYNFLKTSFREAIGQLLEYCYYPDVQNAIKLFIVSDIEPDEEIQLYLKRLKSVFNIPFGYIQFDCTSNTIAKEI